MEDLPSNLQNDLIRPNRPNQWLWLCRFAVSGQTTQYMARNTEDVNYDTTDYAAMALEVGNQTKGGDGSIPEVTLKVTALNETLYDIIQATQGAVGGAVKLIKVNSDFLETAIPALEADYEALAAQADTDWIYFTLGVPNPMNQRYPLFDYCSSICRNAKPGLFKGAECQYTGGETSCNGTLEDCRDNKNNAVNWGGFIGLNEFAMEV